MIYLDTHAALWLHNGDVERLSRAAREAIENNDLLVSPAVVLELGFLFELGRSTDGPAVVVTALRTEYSVEICEHPFPAVALAALELSWTRDPFDRLIVGHAAAAKRQLVTKDASIREHFPSAIW